MSAEVGNNETPDDMATEIKRLKDRIERLRGLAKTAVGMLHDRNADDDAELIQALIGDMEEP